MKILLVDDEKTIRLTLSDSLREAGFIVKAIENGQNAKNILKQEKFDCVISDIRLPGIDGVSLLKFTKEHFSDTEVILITGFGDVEQAVEAVKAGANDYIMKPFMNDEVILRLKKITEVKRLKDENVKLKQQLVENARFGEFVGKSKQMRELFKLIETISKTDSSVLICGDSGTGKELVANSIHYSSYRKNKPFVKLSCAVFPETLLEDELFGHEKGAYTDAKARKTGRFEQANGGTIFLDDIDDMSLKLQVKLLRILQERCFERLGGTQTIQIDIRVIAATKNDLGKLVEEGLFRKDLFYRLNVIPIFIPPLAEHPEDIQLLAEHFIKLYGKGRKYYIQPGTLKAIMEYKWPGNVRELENSIERAIAFAGESRELEMDHLVLSFRQSFIPGENDPAKLRDFLNKVSAEHISKILAQVKGRKTEAARILGISRKCLWKKIKDMGINKKHQG